MAFSVLTNVASLGAQNNLAKTSYKLSANISRLSSGKRINRSSDDAARFMKIYQQQTLGYRMLMLPPKRQQ